MLTTPNLTSLISAGWKKATRPFACQIAESMDLSHFQFGYDARNRCIVTENPKPLSLLTSHQAGTPPAPTAEPSSNILAIAAPARARSQDENAPDAVNIEELALVCFHQDEQAGAGDAEEAGNEGEASMAKHDDPAPSAAE